MLLSRLLIIFFLLASCNFVSVYDQNNLKSLSSISLEINQDDYDLDQKLIVNEFKRNLNNLINLDSSSNSKYLLKINNITKLISYSQISASGNITRYNITLEISYQLIDKDLKTLYIKRSKEKNKFKKKEQEIKYILLSESDSIVTSYDYADSLYVTQVIEREQAMLLTRNLAEKIRNNILLVIE